MKQGMTFEDLLTRVEHEAASRRDYYVPTQEMYLMTDQSGSRLATPCGQFSLKETAHLHLGELCGIDRRYYQRLRLEAPFLLDRNVNHWLANNSPRQRIVRALESDTGSEARAIVSSRYAMLDNDALLKTVEPVIREQGLTVESCNVSDEKLVIKMVSPRLRGEVKVGDEVQAGIIIRNSEVRCSAVEVDWFVKRLVCTNGMIVTGPHGRGAFRRHVGRDWNAPRRKAQSFSWHGATPSHNALQQLTSSAAALPSSSPVPANLEREQWERAIWEQLQASLRQSLNADAFTSLLNRLALTTTLQAQLAPEELTERVGNSFHLSPDEQSMVLFHLTQDSDLSLWGVLNAVTRTSQEVKSYARATALEEIGGDLSRLTAPQWNRLTTPN